MVIPVNTRPGPCPLKDTPLKVLTLWTFLVKRPASRLMISPQLVVHLKESRADEGPPTCLAPLPSESLLANTVVG